MKNIFSVLLLLFFSSCYYDNVSELHPESGLTESCDSTAVTYTKDVQPILASYCGTGNDNCHSQNNTAQNPSLASYTDVSNLVNVDAGEQLVKSITHEDPTNFPPMPQDGGKLSDCKINLIRAWINQGLIQ